jgi:PAS domain S-box-containing protein
MDNLKSLPTLTSIRIKKMLTLPVFENEEQTRIARVLTIILWAVIAVVSGLILTWLIAGKSDELGPFAFTANTIIIGGAGCLLFLIRRAHLTIACIIFLSFLWLNITFQAFTSDGLRGSVGIIYLTIMVLASLLLNWRASIGIAVVSTLSVWILALAESMGLTTFQFDGPYEVAFETSAMLILTAFFLSLSTNSLSKAFKRVHRSEDSIKEANRNLQQKIDQLRRTEESLKKSEANYRELVQHANSIILRFDIQGCLTFFNDFAQSFFGFTGGDILGKNIVGTILPPTESSGRDLVAMIRDLTKNPGRYANNVNENIKRDGERVWVAWTNKPIRDESGKIVEILGVGNDITERKRAEKAIVESEEKFRNIVNSSPMGVHLYQLESDGQLVFTGANPAADHILGVDNSQFVGKTIEQAFPLLVGTEIPERYRKACTDGEPWQTEQINYEDENIKGAFEVHAFRTSSGMMAALFFDITKRKQAEDALMESEERFRILFERAPDPFYINKLDGTFIDGNKAAEKLIGSKRAELIGTNFAEIGLLSDEDLPKALNILEKNQNGEPTGPDEFKLYRKNSKPAYAEISTHPVTIRGEKLVLGIARDITDRKKAEEGRKKLEAQLRQAQKMEAIGTFAGGIAHDFNNILAAIVGYTELALAKISKDAPEHDDLQEIFHSGLRARDLVKQILTFSRQAELNRQPVQVNIVVKEALKFLRSSLPTSIDIRRNIQSDARVLADPTQIHQVLMNLCANAKHAMRKTGGVLEVSLEEVQLSSDFVAAHPGAVAGPHLMLSVTDSGDGMPAEMLEKIFNPFFTTKGKKEGTGLGLAIVHGIVKSCDGFITVDSKPGHGSTFSVFLPVVELQGQPQAELKGPLPKGTERVLLVDDEKVLTDISKKMLERYGYQVTPRTSSVEALELFKAKPDQFDLVITDMTMPNMSGLELASEILKLQPKLPIILCTGFSESINPNRAEAAGLKGFMLKPVSRDDLIRTARKVLDESKKN